MTAHRLRVGMLAPISHGFPPAGYGPWEQVCYDLTEGLVELGHEVVLFGPGDATTSATLVETVPNSLASNPPGDGVDGRAWEDYHIAEAMQKSLEHDVDIIHSHLHIHALGYAPFVGRPLITTLHGAAWDRNHHMMLGRFRRQPFVSLSEAERAFFPELRYVATVPNGIRLADFPAGDGSRGNLVFVGRLAPEKAPDLAIEVARVTDRHLVIAGQVESRHSDYFDQRIRPLLGGGIEYVGALDRKQVAELVGGAAALLMPLRWEEPFGLVVVESLAVGTPVVAWRRGAMAELIDEGETGFLVDNIAQAAAAVRRLGEIDRGVCRARATDRFGHRTMATGYVDAYEKALGRSGEIGGLFQSLTG